MGKEMLREHVRKSQCHLIDYKLKIHRYARSRPSSTLGIMQKINKPAPPDANARSQPSSTMTLKPIPMYVTMIL
jgi:hypothetical protein